MRTRAFGEPIHILLVEDDPADVVLTRETLRDANVPTEMHVVSDGEDALRLLRREPPFEAAPRPQIVLLDLNLPRKSGRDVLVEIKRDPELKAIPVIVLTTSRSERDVVSSYEQHCNAYVTKPIDLDHFLHVVRAVEDFWLRVAQLP